MSTMRRRLLAVPVVLAVLGLAACGSSDSRDRNAGGTALCSQGGPCKVGEIGPAGGIVFVGADTPGTDMWEAAPVNGYGTLEDAKDMILGFDLGGFINWQLPSAQIAEEMWKQADVFACADEADCSSAFAADVYWTGDEVDGGAATKSFVDGSDSADAVTATYYFRPVRLFRMTEQPVVPVFTTVAVDDTAVGNEGGDATTTTTTAVEETTTTASEVTTTTAASGEPTTTVVATDATTTSVTAEAETTTAVAETTTTTVAAGPAKTCAEGGECKPGDRGPAGGTVVKANAINGDPVTLIEVAPITWYGSGPQAKAYVDNLVYRGRDDWKLPSASELLSMRASRALFACAKDTFCTNGFANAPYWFGGAAGAAGIVDFTGKSNPADPLPNTNYRVRPVRVIATLDGVAGPLPTLTPSLGLTEG